MSGLFSGRHPIAQNVAMRGPAAAQGTAMSFLRCDYPFRHGSQLQVLETGSNEGSTAHTYLSAARRRNCRFIALTRAR
ncbi:MAG: hypothetical protein ACLQFI_11415, partial [Methylocella sp.]